MGSGPHAHARIGEIQRYGLRLVRTNRLRHRRVTNVTLTGKMGGGGAVLPILPIIVPVKKNQNADRQCYGDGDGVNRCEQTFSMQFQGFMTHYLMHFFLLNKHHWRIQGFLVNIYKIQG